MKLTKHAWLLWAILLALVLIFSFLIPFVHTATFWVGFAGMMIMFGVCVWVFHRAFRRDDKLESKLLGWPLFRVALSGLLGQVIAGFVLMALAAVCPVWGAIGAEAILYGAVLASLTVKDAAREAVTAGEAQIVDHTQAWKAIRLKANALAGRLGGDELKKLADNIRFADPMPTEMDEMISAQLDLISAADDADQIARAAELVAQRKSAAKLNK